MIKIIEITDHIKDIEKLRNYNYLVSNDLIKKVSEIIENVRKFGDKSIIEYTEKFDNVKLDGIKVDEDDIKKAYRKVTNQQIKAITIMKKRLMNNEKIFFKNIKNTCSVNDGIKFKKIVQPIQSVGCYIPGGKARYPSTLVMCSVPAKIAGVKRIVAISPPQDDGNVDPLTIVTSDICEIDEFYKIGGPHGIAALAFGTQSLKKVDKIVGPGGSYVTAAKQVISSSTSIDMLAGPTELLIYADGLTNPRLVALDLISQAEHSTDTICGVITESKSVASKIKNEIESIISNDKISRKEIVKQSLERNGFIAIAENENKIIEFINEMAPEHLEIMIKKGGEKVAKKVTSGLTLVGENTPSSASDYLLGSNHVLPTMSFGKTRSSLSVMDFIRINNIISSSKKELRVIAPYIKCVTEAEGLFNHYEAVRNRLENKK